MPKRHQITMRLAQISIRSRELYYTFFFPTPFSPQFVFRCFSFAVGFSSPRGSETRHFPGLPAGARWKRSRQIPQAKGTEHLSSGVSSLQSHRLLQTAKPQNTQAERDKKLQNNPGGLTLLESTIPFWIPHLMWPPLLEGDAWPVHTQLTGVSSFKQEQASRIGCLSLTVHHYRCIFQPRAGIAKGVPWYASKQRKWKKRLQMGGNWGEYESIYWCRFSKSVVCCGVLQPDSTKPEVSLKNKYPTVSLVGEGCF